MGRKYFGENVDLSNSFIDSRYSSLIKIGSNVTVTSAAILAHDASTKKFTGYTKISSVYIGDNVFIGYGVIVLPGTQIGNNVIVGAGSVVRGYIPDNSIVVGNPATVIGNTETYIGKHRRHLVKELIYDMNSENDRIRMGKELVDRTGYIL